MMTDDLSVLSEAWLLAKESETEAIKARRAIEDRMRSLIGVSDALEGTETASPDGFTIKMVGRIDRKVDSDKLQELASEAGLSEHLPSLFRWKPEINASVWKATDKSITDVLAVAITAKPGRPSFSIVRNSEEKE